MTIAALFTAVAGARLHSLARMLHGVRTADAAVVLLLSNWFWLYCSSRTLANMTEACLLVLAVHAWASSRRVGAVILFSVAAAARPTSGPVRAVARTPMRVAACFSLPFLALSAAAEQVSVGRVAWLAVVAAAVQGGAAALDSWFYGAPTYTPLNFIRSNIAQVRVIAVMLQRICSTITRASALSMARIPGTGTARRHGPAEARHNAHPPQGLPAVLSVAYPLALRGAGRAVAAGGVSGAVAVACAVYVAAHSAVPHKEFRFVLPVLPFACMFAARELCRLRRCGSVSHRSRQSAIAAAGASCGSARCCC